MARTLSEISATMRLPNHAERMARKDYDTVRRRLLWANDPIGCLGRAMFLLGCAVFASTTRHRFDDVVAVMDREMNRR